MQAKNKFDLVVFDWDGTLMDSTPTIVHCMQAACRDTGLPVPPDATASHVIGLGLKDALTIAVPTLAAQDYPKLAERFKFHYLQHDPDLHLFAGARDLLDELKARGYLLAVATGKPRVGLNRALKHHQLETIFDSTRCADETFSKPHPAMLLEIFEALEVAPARAVMIGDTTHDLQLAHNAGTQGIGIAYGAHPRAELEAARPLAVVKDIAELRTLLL